MTEIKKDKPRKKRPSFDSIMGEYKVYILNYAKDGECRYNIVSTKGEVFKTNSRKKFLSYLGGI